MSHFVDLDEQGEDQLRAELDRRRLDRERGLCDYCHRAPDTSPCKFPERHAPRLPLGGQFVVDETFDLLELLGFCGCGEPEEAVKLAHAILSSRGQKDAWEILNKLLGQSPAAWIVIYHFDRLGLTEHGGSAFGAWLTKRGERALVLLEKWIAANP